MKLGNTLRILIPVMALGAILPACGSSTTSAGTTVPTPNRSPTSTTSSIPTPSSVATTSTVAAASSAPAATATLGTPNPSRCVGCGDVEPLLVKVLAATSAGAVIPEVDFNGIQWQAWGSQSTSASVTAYFTGPGESSPETLTAFDLGSCGGTWGYQALEWTAKGQPFNPSDYFNTCTGQYVGQG